LLWLAKRNPNSSNKIISRRFQRAKKPGIAREALRAFDKNNETPQRQARMQKVSSNANRIRSEEDSGLNGKVSDG